MKRMAGLVVLAYLMACGPAWAKDQPKASGVSTKPLVTPIVSHPAAGTAGAAKPTAGEKKPDPHAAMAAEKDRLQTQHAKLLEKEKEKQKQLRHER